MNPPLPVKAKSKLEACTFRDSGLAPDPLDKLERRWCVCGVRSDHPRHSMPPVSEEERAAAARILGEHE
jgi:hypothetical protein